MPTSTGTKLCVKCGKDVTHDKRMKDASGAYWCLDCGEADSRTKHSASSAAGAQCEDCRGKYPPEQITTYENQTLCIGCAKARQKAANGGVSPDDAAQQRFVRAIAAGVLIAVGITLIVLNHLNII